MDVQLGHLWLDFQSSVSVQCHSFVTNTECSSCARLMESFTCLVIATVVDPHPGVPSGNLLVGFSCYAGEGLFNDA